MKQIIDIPDELFSIFKKHGIMAFDYFNEYDKDQIAIAITHGTPYNPSGDLISREALKEQINATDFDFGDYYDNTEEIRKRVCEVIDNAPPVPQVTVFAENADEKAIEDMKAELQNAIESRPQGEWINEHYDGGFWYHTCNKCKSELEITSTENFCRNCGADMRPKGGAE